MRGEVFFEKMTGISEEYITEAALVPAVGAYPAKRPENRFAALSHVLNSGWGVACICFIVAIAAVVGMVASVVAGDSSTGVLQPHRIVKASRSASNRFPVFIAASEPPEFPGHFPEPGEACRETAPESRKWSHRT